VEERMQKFIQDDPETGLGDSIANIVGCGAEEHLRWPLNLHGQWTEAKFKAATILEI
jgi:hypothetical protein